MECWRGGPHVNATKLEPEKYGVSSAVVLHADTLDGNAGLRLRTDAEEPQYTGVTSHST